MFSLNVTGSLADDIIHVKSTHLTDTSEKRTPRLVPAFLCSFYLTFFAFNRCLCALRLVVKHTRGYCFVLNGFIRLLSSQAISDFTSAASLFAILKISMLRIGFVWIYQVPRLLKRILRYSATVKIILANCFYFKAKDPLCPLSFRSLHGWSTGTLPKRVLHGHRSWPKIHQTSENHRPPDGSPRCGTSQIRMLINSRHNLCYRKKSTKVVTIQLQINVVPN